MLLDRDGVINQPVLDATTGQYESPYTAADVVLVPGIVEVIRRLQDEGIALAVVSNQPAAAKGTHTLDELLSVDEAIKALLEHENVTLPIWHYCFHHPDGTDTTLAYTCDCRKPASGLLRAALDDLGIPATKNVWMIGDSDADIGAGNAIGVTTLLYAHPLTGHRRGMLKPSFQAASVEAIDSILIDHGI